MASIIGRLSRFPKCIRYANPSSVNLTKHNLLFYRRNEFKVPLLATSGTISTDNLKWEISTQASPVVSPIVSTDIIKGAIIPWSQMNFVQKLFIPCTFVIMHYLDFLANHMSWWLAIVGTTATIRLLLFPVVVRLNKIGILSYNILPQTQKIQAKMNEAMMNGDAYTQALCKTKIQLLNKEHGINPMKRLIPIFIQAPMFASMFFLVKSLTNVPVEGLSTGGALWFTDLTVCDPYYILPAITSVSMFLLFEFGLEGGVNPATTMGPFGKYLIRGIPIVTFAVTQSFPAAVLLFWSTSNLFTLFYALILKHPWLKKVLKIPKRIEHKPEDLPLSNMSFKGQMKKAVEQGRARRTTIDVRRLDDIAFKKAGVGPLQKTYKEPPKAA